MTADPRRPSGHPLAVARERVLELVAAPAPLLVVSDFDGTLAPIELDPLAARIDPVARRALRTLARVAERRPGRLRLAVLSGRTALDVATRVRVGGLRYLGTHGIEEGALPRGTPAERLAVRMDPALDRHAPAATAVGRTVAERLGRPSWLFVEPKGPSVAFHFRQAPDADAAREAVLEAIEAAEEAGGAAALARLEGRMVIELRPVGAGGKGAVVERLIDEERPGAALVLGDDRSDAEAFIAIGAARRAGRLRDALAVGVHAAEEVPPAVVEAADVVLDGPRDAARLLETLARALDREG